MDYALLKEYRNELFTQLCCIGVFLTLIFDPIKIFESVDLIPEILLIVYWIVERTWVDNMAYCAVLLCMVRN